MKALKPAFVTVRPIIRPLPADENPPPRHHRAVSARSRTFFKQNNLNPQTPLHGLLTPFKNDLKNSVFERPVSKAINLWITYFQLLNGGEHTIPLDDRAIGSTA
jgi:hypothetical protein